MLTVERNDSVIQSVPAQTLRRLPTYLRYLRSLPGNGKTHVSARAIASALNLGEIQVRKDLSAVSASGRPRIGYSCRELEKDIEACLGVENISEAVLVGAGRLGNALLHYEGFSQYGLSIVAAFDENDSAVGELCNGKQVLPLAKLTDTCRRRNIRIGIIAVPVKSAQRAMDALADAGVLAVWNFAPTLLSVPEGVLVRNEDMAASLAMLSTALCRGTHG